MASTTDQARAKLMRRAALTIGQERARMPPGTRDIDHLSRSVRWLRTRAFELDGTRPPPPLPKRSLVRRLLDLFRR